MENTNQENQVVEVEQVEVQADGLWEAARRGLLHQVFPTEVAFAQLVK